MRAGTYIQSELRATHSGVAGSPITLASFPGERAAILTNTDIYVADQYSYVSFVNLNLGPNPSSATLQSVTIQDFGEHTSWIGNDVNGAGLKTCFEIGSAGWGVAHNTLIQGNRIHDCGARANGNQDHAIYVSQSIGATITGNVIWNAAAYAIHLYPSADNSSVTHNVIDGSGYGGVIFSSDQAAGTGRVSDYNDVSYNVITRGTRLGVQAWWGASGVGTGNTATHNCLYGNAGGDFGGGGDLAAIALSANVNANPLFVNAAARDYRLGAGSGCLAVVGTDTAANLP